MKRVLQMFDNLVRSEALLSRVSMHVFIVLAFCFVSADLIAATQFQKPTYLYQSFSTLTRGFTDYDAAVAAGIAAQRPFCEALGGEFILGADFADPGAGSVNTGRQIAVRCFKNGNPIPIGSNLLVSSQCPASWNNNAVFPGFDSICAANDFTPNTAKQLGIPKQCNNLLGNPCNLTTGNKIETATDYRGHWAFPLTLTLTYNSQIEIIGSFGRNWWSNFDRKIVPPVAGSASYPYVAVYTEDGKAITYVLTNGIWQSTGDVSDRLEQLSNGWQVTRTNDDIELYDALGKLLSISNRAGLSINLAYSDGTTSGPNGGVIYDASSGTPIATSTPLPAGLIIRATDFVGRSIVFNYDAQRRVVQLVDPSGGTYVYLYNSDNVLTRFRSADNTVRTYHYEVAAKPFLLTGITDEKGDRFSAYMYDSSGLVTSSEHAGSAGKVTLTYPTIPNSGNGVTQVTSYVDAGQTAIRSYSLTVFQGLTQTTGISGPVCPSCGPASTTFDANGFPASLTDWNGNRTNYVYDTRGLETSRTEGLTAGGGNTPQTRTITTAYHPTFRLPTLITEPGRTTNLSYDASGNLLTKSVTDTATSKVRTFTYTYNSNGQVLTLDGPRTDATDITTYTYYPNGDADHGRAGQLASITNALGQTTNITTYNAHGQPLTIVDPNGLTTQLSYDARLRLTSRNVGGETSTYAYDGVGQLTQVTLPDGSFLNYTYDAAHRLTQIADNLGNRIAYTLDLMGNRTKEDVFDPLNALAQTRSRVYSNLNRLAQEIGAQAQTTTYAYDNQGNLTSIDGPFAGTVDVTTNAYDVLNRLVRVTDPNAGQVNYVYNALDQLTSVADPRSLVTSYSYDGLNNLNQQASPDTGTTGNTYDAAGNLLTQTDAKGQVTSYAYDALNRVTSITYQGGVIHTYQYDQGANGLGRLTQVTEPNSTTQYAYDQKGRLTSETRLINAVSYVTSYSYDAAGRMTGMIYPSGRQVSYTLDSLGRIQQIATTKDATTQTVVSSVAYRPFGPTQSFTFGNGQTYSRGFDQDGRIASYTLAVQTFAVGYDAASRISFLSDVSNPTNSNTYGYDSLDRLTNAVLPGTPFAYSYDAVGNRLAKTVGSSTDTYAYSATSNRLASITLGAGPLKNYVHDATGSVTADGANSYAYDTRGRLTQAVSVVGTSNYQINSLGQRIRKTNTQGDTVIHYDSQGRLIAESSASGTLQKEYIYLGDIPVAVFQ